jgi:hypothetical protein
MSTWLLIAAQRTAYPGLFAIRNAGDWRRARALARRSAGVPAADVLARRSMLAPVSSG